jgi:hypothetical protein
MDGIDWPAGKPAVPVPDGDLSALPDGHFAVTPVFQPACGKVGYGWDRLAGWKAGGTYAAW